MGAKLLARRFSVLLAALAFVLSETEHVLEYQGKEESFTQSTVISDDPGFESSAL